jgi:hypothetical protein
VELFKTSNYEKIFRSVKSLRISSIRVDPRRITSIIQTEGLALCELAHYRSSAASFIVTVALVNGRN